MFLRRTIPAFVAVTLALALTGCAKGPQVTSIAITPAAGIQVLTGVGQTAQYAAIGTFKQSTHPAFTQNITDQVTWGSAANSIATINAATGLATSTGSGTTTITANYEGAIGSSDLTVTTTGVGGGGGGAGHILLSVAVDPATQTLNIPGQTAQFIAIGTFNSSPVSMNLTNSAAWTSSDPSVVTINPSGLATVTPAGCPTASCTVTIIATGTDASGNSAVGQATLIVASSAGSAPRSLTSLAIIPSSQTLNTLGETSQFIAIGTYNSSPTTVDLTPTAAWGSSDTSIATIGTSGTPATTPGLATAVGCGAFTCVATITATVTDPISGAIIGSAALTVSPGAPATKHSLTNITIYPGTGTQTLYGLGDTAQFIAVGTYNSSPVTQDITNFVTWGSVAVDIATINSSGLATAVNCTSPANPPACTTVITATCLASQAGCSSITDVVGTSSLILEPGGVNPSLLPSLEVYTVGAGTGTVTSTPAGVSCTSGSAPGCTGYFTAGSSVTLTVTSGAANFGGWSANCTPVTATTCTVPMTGNQAVGAIFN